MPEQKPFHESIVDAILRSEGHYNFMLFGRLIMETKIPASHDVIIDAWKKQVAKYGIRDDPEVVASILAQKQALESGDS